MTIEATSLENSAFERIKKVSKSLAFNVGRTISYTIAAPIVEGVPVWNSVYRLMSYRDDEEHNLRLFKIAALNIFPAVFAVGAAVGTYYLNIITSYHCDMFYKSYILLDNALPSDVDNWIQFTSYFVSFTILYTLSQVCEALVNAVNSTCTTESIKMVKDEWNEIVLENDGEIWHLIGVSSDPKVKNFGAGAGSFIGNTLQYSNKVTVLYIVRVTQTLMAIEKLFEIDPMYLLYMAGISLGLNFIYVVLIQLHARCKAKQSAFEKDEQARNANITDNIVNTRLERKVNLANKIADHSWQHSLKPQMTMETFLRNVLNIWSHIATAARAAISYFLVGTALYNGDITYASKSNATIQFDNIAKFTELLHEIFHELIWTISQNSNIRQTLDAIYAYKNSNRIIPSIIHNQEMAENFLEIEELTITPTPSRDNMSPKPIIHKFSYNFSKRITFICGSNGAGKSTLTHALALDCKMPEFNIEGNIRKKHEKIYYLSSAPFILSSYKDNEDYQSTDAIYRAILSGTKYSLSKEHKQQSRRQEIKEILEALEIESLLSREEDLASCSTGEKQLIAIVGQIINKPQVLVIDETFSNIDAAKRSKVLELLAEKLPETKFIIIQHSPEEIRNIIHAFSNQDISVENVNKMLQNIQSSSTSHVLCDDYDDVELVSLKNNQQEYTTHQGAYRVKI